MGTQKARKRNDFYPTIDPRAVQALAQHLPAGTVYAEPCAGDGALILLLDQLGLVCDWALELEPQGSCLRNRWPIARGNALQLGTDDLGAAMCFITNPPWSRQLLHALIAHLARIAPTWFLFDASWKHTQQAAMFAPICTDIVSVGRLKWFAGSKYDPPDDCAWYCFDARPGSHRSSGTRFHFRTAPAAATAQLALF
jgi:hypothetical protein